MAFFRGLRRSDTGGVLFCSGRILGGCLSTAMELVRGRSETEYSKCTSLAICIRAGFTGDVVRIAG